MILQVPAVFFRAAFQQGLEVRGMYLGRISGCTSNITNDVNVPMQSSFPCRHCVSWVYRLVFVLYNLDCLCRS